MRNFAESFYAWYRNTLRNTKYRWLIVVGTLIYLISPIDISPDFLPIIGWIDDGVIASLLIAEVSLLMTEFLTNRGKRPSAETAIDSDLSPDTVVDVQVQ